MAGGDARLQPGVAVRIGAVRAGADHRHGAATGVQRGLVRGRIDARGQATGHGQAGLDETARKTRGQCAPARGGGTAADQRHRGAPGQAGITGDEQRQRRVGHLQQRWRKGRIGAGQQVVVVLFQPAQGGCPGPAVRTFQCGALLRRAAVRAPVRAALRDGGLRIARGLQQRPSWRQCASRHQQAQQRLICMRGHPLLSAGYNEGALGRLRM